MFKTSLTALFVVLISSCAHSSKKTSSVPTSPNQTWSLNSPLADQKAMQELTGKPVSNLPTASQLKNKPLSMQHYYAGLRMAESKNYIMAIKHFNTVLKKYPRSNEVKLAFAAKAKVYSEMGLSEPASLNRRLAQSQSKLQVSQKKTAAVQKGQKTNTK